MPRSKKINNLILKIVGLLIACRGLFHIIFMNSYIQFMNGKFFNDIPFETLFVIVASIFPFIEFFIGLLIFFKIKLEEAIVSGIFVYTILIVFTIIDSYYDQTIYLMLILFYLIYAFFYSKKQKVKRII